MAARFRKVTAVDPSLSMLEKGIQPSDPNLPRVEYKQGDAQDLQCVGEEGADLVVAGEYLAGFPLKSFSSSPSDKAK